MKMNRAINQYLCMLPYTLVKKFKWTFVGVNLYLGLFIPWGLSSKVDKIKTWQYVCSFTQK